MQNKLRIIGLDPAISNLGICVSDFDPVTNELDIVDLVLIKTENNPAEKRSLDDLRRAREIHAKISSYLTGAVWVAVELPQPNGANVQSRSIWTSGILFGLIAAIDIPLIEVTPIEVKMASVGKKTATKQDMIDWATKRWPEAAWLSHTSKGQIIMNKDNEHIADAAGVVVAGLLKPSVQQTLAFMRSKLLKAAA